MDLLAGHSLYHTPYTGQDDSVLVWQYFKFGVANTQALKATQKCTLDYQCTGGGGGGGFQQRFSFNQYDNDQTNFPFYVRNNYETNGLVYDVKPA